MVVNAGGLLPCWTDGASWRVSVAGLARPEWVVEIAIQAATTAAERQPTVAPAAGYDSPGHDESGFSLSIDKV